MERVTTLREVLALYDPYDALPDQFKKGSDYENILPDAEVYVSLRFMSEDKTWISTYAEHPILIPWYDCPVQSIDAQDDHLVIWLDYEGKDGVLAQMVDRRRDSAMRTVQAEQALEDDGK